MRRLTKVVLVERPVVHCLAMVINLYTMKIRRNGTYVELQIVSWSFQFIRSAITSAACVFVETADETEHVKGVQWDLRGK